jgi:hypothetical protein
VVSPTARGVIKIATCGNLNETRFQHLLQSLNA